MSADRYRAAGWWRPERVDDLVLRHAGALAGRCAVVGEQRRMTYRQLAAAVDGTAARLHRLGLRAPEPVLLQLPNTIELLVLALALMRAGCPPVLAMPTLREHELRPVIATLRPAALAVPPPSRAFDHMEMARRLIKEHDCVRTLLAWDDLRALCSPADGEPVHGDPVHGDPVDADPGRVHASQPHDIALHLLSSGTTGPPKGIPRTHEAFTSVIRAASDVSVLDRDTVYLAAIPVTHSFAFGHPGVLGTLAHGGRVVLARSADPAHCLDLVERERVTHCALVPGLAAQWLTDLRDHPRDVSSLRVLQVGGARLDPALARRLATGLDCAVQQVYGMSEGLLCFTRLDDPDDMAATTQGRPAAPGDELRVVDDAGRTVPPGTVGELWTRGPSTITAYAAGARPPEAFAPGGFYRTGDLVRLDDAGNAVVVGRVKDVINRSGEKIPAGDLETLLMRHPAVCAAAVVAMPHPLHGEAVCAVVVPPGDDAPTLRELRDFLRAQGVAPFKLPDRLEVVAALPTTGVGKVDKARLRRTVAELVAAGRQNPAGTTAVGQESPSSSRSAAAGVSSR
ncbi:AMP-binding protein [Streptomyces sp. BR123]|uniref:(2,3-dihydroxybenzoyl)adenylate synthase n=1 Tax=Streptomyces sp. BR123 TaxID=2749828 RepID=UPI0015C47BEF|nr:AMP-binding protein [Streptomyces sp. BR123]NXY93603.1 AMP-binding protein [Streptomyces sp. BR123]